MNLQQLCKDVCDLAKKTGEFLKTEIGKVSAADIEIKGLHDFVTYVDKTSEKAILAELQKLLPEAGFIAEEKTITTKSEKYNWIVDPLDGTTNFIHRLPCYSVSIALAEKDEIILGVVYEVNLDECFYAFKGGNAYLNGNKIHVSDKRKVSDALVATGFPYYDFSDLKRYMELFTYFLRNSHGIRRLGSAAVDLAYVACGRFEAFFEYGLNPWDVAAGALIVQQAGGKVCDFKGGQNYLFGKEITASNYLLSEEFSGIVKSVFKA
jgi:myo-inositol-1(or 4)-monophosphatase